MIELSYCFRVEYKLSSMFWGACYYIPSIDEQVLCLQLLCIHLLGYGMSGFEFWICTFSSNFSVVAQALMLFLLFLQRVRANTC